MNDDFQNSNLESRPESFRFTMILNDAIRDPRLSWRAKGILAGCLSHASGFNFSKAWILSHGTEGRDAITAALRQLRELGYLESEIQRCPKTGRVLGERLIFTDRPSASEGEEPVADGARQPEGSEPEDWKPGVRETSPHKKTNLQEYQLKEKQDIYGKQEQEKTISDKNGKQQLLLKKVLKALEPLPDNIRIESKLITEWLLKRKARHRLDPEITSRSLKALEEAKKLDVLAEYCEIAAERGWSSLGFVGYADFLEKLSKEKNPTCNNTKPKQTIIKPKATLH
jgi:hypothetical protein